MIRHSTVPSLPPPPPPTSKTPNPCSHLSNNISESRNSVSSLSLPADRVLNSGAVLFPGTFDRHGSPLVVFPVEEQVKLASDITQAEVADFINYFLSLHNKKQNRDSLVSLVCDLKDSSLVTARFIAETVLILEQHERTVHTIYLIQPKKKEASKLLLKLLLPSKSFTTPFQKVLLKDGTELYNYIDRSQLPQSLGGYLVYCHQSWVAFIKEIDAFVHEFVSVVQRLPSCIDALRALSNLPVPDTFSQLKDFCSANEARFLQLRRELGLDELLKYSECIVGKLRYPEEDICYQAMAGTALFHHTTLDMLQNYSRITVAVEKVELLWQQAFSKARRRIQILKLWEESLQITEQIDFLLKEKVQPFKMQITKDVEKARKLTSEYETSVYTPAMVLVRWAENVIHMLAELLPPGDYLTKEKWVVDLERLKEKLHSAVETPHQTLRAASDFHYYYNKIKRWCDAVLCECFLQEILSGFNKNEVPQRQSSPALRQMLSSFLRRNPPPVMDELFQLAHLASAIPDYQLHQAGKQLSQRCMTLRNLINSPEAVAFNDLQLALKWQYEMLSSKRISLSNSADVSARRNEAVKQTPSSTCNQSLNIPPRRTLLQDIVDGISLPQPNNSKAEHAKVPAQCLPLLETSPPAALSGTMLPSLSSFDSGFDGAGRSYPEAAWDGLSRYAGTSNLFRHSSMPVQIHEGDVSSVSGSEEHREDLGLMRNSSRASIQIIPQATLDSLNFEIHVKRSASPPKNPWLSLPVDDLEKSYTVTITPNTPAKQSKDNCSEPCVVSGQSTRSRDQLTQTEVAPFPLSTGTKTRDWPVHSQMCFEEDVEISPICNILSSTITDSRDNSTTEGLPTFLWDSYDLHDQNQDVRTSDSMLDISLKDWDLKEHQGLREVEKILGRADVILKEEENVLAQEAALDDLLRSQGRLDPWTLWGSEDQSVVASGFIAYNMTSSELADAGVLGIEDVLPSANAENLPECRSNCSSEAELSEDNECSDVPQKKGSLLTELRQVHLLDELIVEENLKIHKFQQCEKNFEDDLMKDKHEDGDRTSSKEKQAFRLKLEKEKNEVEITEKGLNKVDGEKKLCLRKSTKDGKFNIQERATTDSLEHQTHCRKLSDDTQMLCQDGQHKGSQLGLDPNTATVTTFKDSVLSDNQNDFAVNYLMCADNPSGCTVTLTHEPPDVEKPGKEVILSQECKQEIAIDADEKVSTCQLEASLTPQMPNGGAFDPGGKLDLLPMPKPRKVSINASLSEQESCLSTESTDVLVLPVNLDPVFTPPDLRGAAPKPKERKKALANSHTPFLTSDSRKYSCNNNNNNLRMDNCTVSPNDHSISSEILTEGGNDFPMVLHSQPLTALSTPQRTQTCASEDVGLQSLPRVPPDLVLACEPAKGGGRGEGLPVVLENCKASRGAATSLPVKHLAIAREMNDFKTPIVLDTGSGLMKAGFADQDLPGVTFPTVIGMPKYMEIINGNYDREGYIGHEAQHMRGVLTLKYPMKNGIINNWDEMERIWHHAFQQLNVEPEDHPVMLTEAPMNPVNNRQRMVEIMFEGFHVPFTYVALQAVLALYASGRTTGLVFDSGDGVSHSLPVFDGYCLPHAVQRFPLAGVDVTMHLKKLLQEQGVSLRTTAEMEIVRDMKEKYCRVALGYEAELAGSSGHEVCYTMPDGQTVCLGTETFRAPEILFKPELIGRDHYGMHESIFKAVLSSDIDLRKSFLGNIVLSGGNTMLAGFPERLQAELRSMVPSDFEACVRVASPKDRDFSVWRGGAVLTNLPSFTSAWISQDEYDEYGPQIVLKKCF